MSIFTEVSVSKPSKALNVVYIIFGYVIASVLIPKSDVLEQVTITLVVGGLLATFLFYVKPVERVLFMGFTLLKEREIRQGASWFHRLRPARLREVFNCPMIANEKMTITGAIFFSTSIVISGKILDQIGMPQPFMLLVLFSLPTLTVALWESYNLWSIMHVLVIFYYFVDEGKIEFPFMTNLRKAIERKDWLEARLIINSQMRLGAAYGKGGLCAKCKTIKSLGDHCDVCGRRLLTHCPNCSTILIGVIEFPRFCPYCGKKIPD